MEAEILKLRNDGKTYNEIVKILGCSKSTVSYYCGVGQKEKTKNRIIKNRKTRHGIFKKKLEMFLRVKVHNFKRGTYGGMTFSNIDYKEIFEKIIKNPYCYLTGRKLNLDDGYSYL